MHGPWRRGKGRRTFSIIALRSTSNSSFSHLENAEERTVTNHGGVSSGHGGISRRDSRRGSTSSRSSIDRASGSRRADNVVVACAVAFSTAK